jgi:hypothetical protein
MNRRATPYLSKTDLPGSALLLNADRVARGLAPLEGEALARAARLYHNRVEVDRHRREAGRRTVRPDGTERVSTGVRVGLTPPSGSANPEDRMDVAHSQSTEPSPPRVAEAKEALGAIQSMLPPEEATALMGAAAGLEGVALLRHFAAAHPDSQGGRAAAEAVRQWESLDRAARARATSTIRRRLRYARERLDRALEEGGALAALGADGWRPRREKGGAR